LQAAEKDDEGAAKLSPEEVRDNAVAFLFAGSETTATSTCWTLFHLTHNPEAYKKLQAEVDAAMAGDTVADVEELERMPYLAQCFKESMRLSHPGFATSLKTLKVETQLGNHKVPAGVNVQVDTGLVHMNPRVYPEPAKYNPERWDVSEGGEEGKTGLNSWAYLPLGAGTRHCIGKNFAYQEAHIMLAMIVKRYDWTLAEGQPAEVLQEFKPPLLPPAGGVRFAFASR